MGALLEGIRQECNKREEFNREEAIQEFLVLESIQLVVRDSIRYLTQIIREEEDALTPQQSETNPTQRSADEPQASQCIGDSAGATRDLDQAIRIRNSRICVCRRFRDC